jgi:hypothetical protein
MPRAVPNYLTTTPDGRVGANFSGHVHAAGLDLDSDNTGSPPVDRRIRWLRPDTGALVADISSGFLNNTGTLDLEVLPNNNGTNGGAQINLNAGTGGRSQIGIAASTPGSGVQTGRVLLDDLGASSFLQGACVLGGSFNLNTLNPWSPGVINFTTGPASKQAIFGVQTSAYLPAGSAQCSFDLYLDSVKAASGGFTFNNASEHHLMSWAIGTRQNVSGGNHTLQLIATGGGFAVDASDYGAWFFIG